MDYVARTPKQLAPILKSCRVQRQLTQQTVGSKVGLKQATVSALETDASRSSVATLYKLLSALGLELVIRDPQAKPPSSGTKKRAEW